jgi:hypothetical protein
VSAGRFGLGFVAGVSVVPVTIACSVVASLGVNSRWLLFALLTVGGLLTGPRGWDRVAGYVTGFMVVLVAGIVWFLWALSTQPWG